MLGPLLCGLLSQAPLLPKLRGHFAEFLNNASPAGLRILSSSTCVGLRYGCDIRNSGFSRQPVSMLRYFCSLRITLSDCMADLPAILLWCLHRIFLFRPMPSRCVPTVLIYHSTGISTCCPSATSSDLALGPDLPRADQLTLETLDIRPRRFPLLSRYSFRHSLFKTVHHSFRYGFVPSSMLLYQSFLIPELRCRVSAPDIFGAGPLDQ